MGQILLTKRQKEFLRAIYSSLKNEGYPPTFEELRQQFDISSNQAIIDHLNALEKKGVITRDDTARGIRISPLGYKILDKDVLIPATGTSFAGPVAESVEIRGEWQAVSQDVHKLNDEVFIIKINGDSMINAGIQDGDQLLVKKEKEFRSGDIVLAQTPEGTTVKKFISQDAPPYLFLKPENPKYKIIHFTEEITLQGKIIGKFTAGKIEQLVQRRFL